ncbi:hypothetical protein [Cardinium endosymbiont of Culicoides punctatus]|nr:hypothetical protein [Cardinium endosymbiont of Culicoides punctatus]
METSEFSSNVDTSLYKDNMAIFKYHVNEYYLEPIALIRHDGF